MDCSMPGFSARVCLNSWPLNQWCHPTISSSVAPFSSCLQSFQASGSFLMCWFFASGGQSVGASALNYLHETIKGESAQQCLALSLPLISSQRLQEPELLRQATRPSGGSVRWSSQEVSLSEQAPLYGGEGVRSPLEIISTLTTLILKALRKASWGQGQVRLCCAFHIHPQNKLSG